MVVHGQVARRGSLFGNYPVPCVWTCRIVGGQRRVCSATMWNTLSRGIAAGTRQLSEAVGPLLEEDEDVIGDAKIKVIIFDADFVCCSVRCWRKLLLSVE